MTFQIHSEKEIGVSCLVTHSPYCQLATSGHHISPVSSWEVLRLYTRLGTRQHGQKYDDSKVNRWNVRWPMLPNYPAAGGPKVNTKVTWPTWFLTGVTTPFCLQSMAFGTVCRLPRWPVPLRVAEQFWNRKILVVIKLVLISSCMICIPGVPWDRSPWIPQIPCQQNNSVPL